MELSDYRNQIDHIDKELIRLFAERMDVAAEIAAYKKEHGLAVLDPARERAKLLDVAEQTPEALQEYAVSLYSLLFELSRSYQNRLLEKPSALTQEIQAAIEQTPKLFPQRAAVACQGVAGIRSSRATSCSGWRTCCISIRSRLCSRPSRRDSANTAWCRWRTARLARSTRSMT